MNMDIKPIVVVSKCLGFEACRYNGQMSNDEFIKKLKQYVEFITVCPEVEIGLQIPRDAIRIVKVNDNLKLIQPKTGKDYTKTMFEFSKEFLEGLNEVDGFILKSRSPSCGIKDVKIYNGLVKGASCTKGKGIFGEMAIEKFPNVVVEDEGRLKDFKIREHFLTKLFIISDFKRIRKLETMYELDNFHKRNKLLFSMYNKTQLKVLNDIIKNRQNKKVNEVFKEYEKCLALVFARKARQTSQINSLIECLNYFSEKIEEKEKKFVIDTIEKYKEGHIPFNVPLYLVKSYAVRFNDKTLLEQSFFNPYPDELVEMRDSGKVLT
ncbi:DUF523 and DUF1722 domain-containing protein [Clostridium aestuarii]|uniref:DUF523 and DUF1722 domain-containing protein n=1 Tax=Clostridium aestuarii TaxID=338193 RepID=A0ABT4CYL9_9CLOT|nr:DUF523 and DUF1722 domain-containing protein [Clostridium aestuarii]MCY6484059.1 DUF523 and DUF1722 domain-containing protein [Clostridium aestuarii]